MQKLKRYISNKKYERNRRNKNGININFNILLISLLIVILIVLGMFFKNKIKNKTKDKNIQIDDKYSQTESTNEQDNITTFAVPEEVIESIFQKSKNSNKQIAKSLASYIVKKPGLLSSKKTRNTYNEAVSCYKQFATDLDMFPISIDYEYTYEDSWNATRSYGGDRKHYGTDIMDSLDERGLIPILSMSDGVVESIGWNNMGGNRVGIRTENGAYIYYAHLSDYNPNITEGSEIKSGDILGHMGDTGYGEEGTVGEFPVHLHIGIATKIFDDNEVWVNPYYILKYLENKNTQILNSKGIF